MKRTVFIIPLTLAFGAIIGCERSPSDDSTPSDDAWFVNEADARGLQFTYISGASPSFLMPEIMGGGAALVDVDDDGDLDLYCVQGGGLGADTADGPIDRLFINDGTGHFTDQTDDRLPPMRGYGMGVAAGDIDNDGDTDLYITNVGPDVLLQNDGAGRFEDVSRAAGIEADGWSTSATFVDLDHDGHLDLYVCQYLDNPMVEMPCFNTTGARDYCSPRNYMAPAQDRVFRNTGNGRFIDATDAAGVAGTRGTGLGVVAGDFTGDDRTDLFVANDGMGDHLWVNDGTGRLIERSVAYGCAFDHDGRASAGMGVAAGDVDHDGDLDLIVCNLRNEPDNVFRNDNGFFANVSVRTEIGAINRRHTRFGLGWVDFDHDGELDLYEANGRVMTQPDVYTDDPYAEPDRVFRGCGDWRFEERPVTSVPLSATSRAAAFGDVDGDGGVDVVVINRDGPAHLLMNRVTDRGAWVGLSIRDASGRPALGATVEIEAPERTVRRDVRAGFSYLASSDPRVHVGLGSSTDPVRARVRWPDGATTTHDGLALNRWHAIERSPSDG